MIYLLSHRPRSSSCHAVTMPSEVHLLKLLRRMGLLGKKRQRMADLRQRTADLRQSRTDLRQSMADLRESTNDLRQCRADLRQSWADLEVFPQWTDQ